MSSTILRADGEPLRTLSASAISTFLTCPEKYRWSYLLGNWGKASAATILGNAYHHARRVNYEQKVFSYEDLDVGDVLDAYDEGWTKAVDEAHNEHVWRDSSPGVHKDLGAKMARIYHDQLSPTVQPVATEERFEIPVSGVPVIVSGFVDVRTDQGRIIDTKTDAKGVKSPKPEWRVQSLVYFTAWPEYDFEWHVHSKSGGLTLRSAADEPSLLVLNTAAKRRSAERIVQQTWKTLLHFYETYGLENPWPGTALTHPWACNICSHKGGCFWWL